MQEIEKNAQQQQGATKQKLKEAYKAGRYEQDVIDVQLNQSKVVIYDQNGVKLDLQLPKPH